MPPTGELNALYGLASYVLDRLTFILGLFNFKLKGEFHEYEELSC